MFDFFPPLLSVVGLILFCRLTRGNGLWTLAVAGSALVATGGFLKASWKLLWVATAVDYNWMSSALFWCLGSGFMLLAGAAISVMRSGRGAGAIGMLTIGLTLAIVMVAWMQWLPSRVTMLGATVIANLVFMISLIAIARRQQKRSAAGLIVLNIVLTFVLAGLARIPEQTAALQWVEESLNFVAQGAFALASWLIWNASRATDTSIKAASTGESIQP